MYFYIQNNKDWNYENKVKYGITCDYKNRLKTDQHSYPSKYINLYEYDDENCKLKYKEADSIIKNTKKDDFKVYINSKYPLVKFKYLFKIKDFIIDHGGGTEFIYKNGIELLEKILLEDFNKIGIIVRKIPEEEWDFTRDKEENIQCKSYINIHEKTREYQEKIINDALINIRKDNRIYISLPTGSGKSFISYKIFNELPISTIIILTPRINICQQNINNKYLNLL